jgi:lipoate-protein ligase A
MRTWRLIVDNAHAANQNMGLDYALLKLCRIPTLRLYMWNPPAVSIGYFQSMSEEVDIDKCKTQGIDYVRRITGGGAVFHDKEITYSVIIDENNPIIPKDIKKSYESISSAVIFSLKKIGVNASYAPLNDIVVNGKKISGCAQTRKEGRILHHGTLLLDVDVERMFSVLKVPNEKLKGKIIMDVKERVTSINQCVSGAIQLDGLIKSMVNGFEEYFKIKFDKTNFSRQEIAIADQLAEAHFNSEWNLMR